MTYTAPRLLSHTEIDTALTCFLVSCLPAPLVNAPRTLAVVRSRRASITPALSRPQLQPMVPAPNTHAPLES